MHVHVEWDLSVADDVDFQVIRVYENAESPEPFLSEVLAKDVTSFDFDVEEGEDYHVTLHVVDLDGLPSEVPTLEVVVPNVPPAPPTNLRYTVVG